MRLKNSFLNMFSIILMQMMSFVLGFLARKIFLTYLPVSLLGVSDLFNNLFYSIGLIDIGFSTILVYNLYKPLNANDQEKVREVVALFKKLYRIIGTIVFLISIGFMPFLYQMFKIDYNNAFVIYMSYLIQLITVVSNYFFIHKNNIMTVGQQKWKINFCTIGIDIFIFILKTISLLIFQSYLLYLIALLLQTLLLNGLNLYLTNRHYPYLKKLPKVYVRDILQSQLVAQSHHFLYHVFYNFIYYSTDNFIMGNQYGTTLIGYFNNYLIIIHILSNFLSILIASLRDSMANFLHEKKDPVALYELFEMIHVLNYFIVSVSVVGLYALIDNFIALMYNTGTKNFILERGIVVLLIINLAIDLLFRPLENVYTIKGYVFKEKWPIFISALVNIIASLWLMQYWGVIGIFIGTFLGKIIFWVGKWFYVFTDVFQQMQFKSFILYGVSIVSLILQTALIGQLAQTVFSEVSRLMTFILKGVLVSSLCILSSLMIWGWTSSFQRLLEMVKSTLKQFDGREKR